MSAGRPRISVVVPFQNSERYLARCIEGLRAQLFERKAFEIILVDNASTDGSAAIAERYDDVTLLRQPVVGSYAARNMGIRASRGDIVATLDSDCCPDSDWLEQIEAGMQDRCCMILLGHQRHATNSEALQLLEMYEAAKVAYVTHRGEKEIYFGYTNNMAFRRALFDSTGLFPERVRGGDTLFVRRAVDALGCDVVRFNPEMRTTHLELDTVRGYYLKRAIYGRSNERISHVVPFRALRNAERWSVFRNVTRKHRLSTRKAFLLLALLVPGALLYEGGRRRGMFQRA